MSASNASPLNVATKAGWGGCATLGPDEYTLWAVDGSVQNVGAVQRFSLAELLEAGLRAKISDLSEVDRERVIEDCVADAHENLHILERNCNELAAINMEQIASTQLLLRTIRALSLTGEAAASFVLNSLSDGKPVDQLEMKLPVLCADRAEHAVQYALDDLSDDVQTRYLLGDVQFLIGLDRGKLGQATGLTVPDDAELYGIRHELTSRINAVA